MKANASVPPHVMWDLLICSLRYAMGRRTGIVSDVCGHIRAYHEYLEPWQVKQIAREIREEIAFVQRTQGPKTTLGAACDHEDWTELAEFLESK